MKIEKIITSIEKYLNTLNESEKAEAFELSEIVLELRQKLKEKALKETHGSTYLKRSKLVSKLLSKCFREDMQKAFNEKINGENVQCCIIDDHYAFAFKNPLDLPMAEESKFTISKFLPDYSSFDKVEYDIAEIKTTLKLHKAEKKKEKCIIEINKKCYDAQYFINVIEALGEDATFYQSEKWNSLDVFENKNGIAVLCPCKPATK